MAVKVSISSGTGANAAAQLSRYISELANVRIAPLAMRLQSPGQVVRESHHVRVAKLGYALSKMIDYRGTLIPRGGIT
jgi:hypothetical protein